MEENENKELEMISLKRDLENVERELKLNKEQEETLSKKKDFLTREKNLVKLQTEKALENWILLKPNWKFEEDPEYIEYGKKMAVLNLEKKMFEYKINEDQISSLLNSIKEQHASVEQHKENILKKLEGEENE